MKTKEQIKKYNKEYFARPEVIAHAKERNKRYRLRRKLYKKTVEGRKNENKYRNKRYSIVGYDERLMIRYGITSDDYAKMFVKQNGVCAICGKKPDLKLHVDHCHKTKKVRGLLCGNCNRGLGLFKDEVESLEKAIQYLKYLKCI
jgi:hypothetical protein